jgi:chromosome segregation ATPase
MNKIIRKIFSPLISLFTKKEESRHFTDLVNGPKVYLNGKPYVKVKFRFVDTLDFNTAHYIDQLESINEINNLKIDSLNETNESLNQKVTDLQNLNVNLMRDLQTKLKEKDLSIINLTESIAIKEELINQLTNTIKDSNPLIEFLKEQTKLLESKIKTKDQRIRSLETELQHTKSSKKLTNITRKEIENLMKNPGGSISSQSKLLESGEKDIVIKILKDREKDYQRKIDNLTKEIDSLKKNNSTTR